MTSTGLDSSSAKVLYILPDLIAFLFIVFLPSIYRHIVDSKIENEVQELGLATSKKAALALANFHQDLSLLTSATMVLLFGAVKFAQVLQMRSIALDSATAVASAVLLTLALVGFLFAAHIQSKATDYRDVDSTSGKNIIFGIPPYKRMRVAGVWGRWIFWGRFLFAGANLAISIVAIS